MRQKSILGLDLLKAIAIVLIVIYHINAAWLTGGFVGVDLFFVISGYLLGSSLVRRYRKNENVSVVEIIWKRIKQLWPVLFLVVFLTTVYITIFNKPILDIAHRDVIPSLTFTNNIWFIVNNIGYFESYFQSPFKHLWYISVLMQSYIVIAIIFKFSNLISSNKNFKLFRQALALLAIASFVLSQILFDPLDVSRVYYGTDTRIYEIIIGVLASFYVPLDNLYKNDNKKTNGLLLVVLGFVSLVALILASIFVSEVSTWVYRIGFLLFTLNSLLLIFTVGNDNNPVFNKYRYIPFLKGLGSISYSIYLWHFPILILTKTKDELNSPDLKLTILRLVLILLLSIFTYNFIEKPIRKVRKSRPRSRRERKEVKKQRRNNTILNRIALGLFVIFLLGTFGVSIPFISTAFVDEIDLPDMPDELITQARPVENMDNIEGVEIIKGTQEVVADETGDTDQTGNNAEAGQANENAALVEGVDYDQLILIGDSLGINVGLTMQNIFPTMIVDAKVSRQLSASEEIFALYTQYDSPDTAIIMMLGTNGGFGEEHLDRLFTKYPQSQKIIVNVNMPNSWRDHVNTELANYVQKHPEIALVDWYSASINNPQYFQPDNTHLVPEGVDAMMELILAELRK